MSEATLYIQKTTDGSELKDSLKDFGFAIGDYSWPAEEMQDVSTRTWPNEHGEDVYISPYGMKLKAYDVEIPFLYKGEIGSAYARYKAFRNYLAGIDGSGAEFKMYDPEWGVGRTGVFMKKISDLTPYRTNADEGITFKATLRVSDPITEIGVGVNEDGVIISLGAV